MKKIERATSDGIAFESNDVEGIWTAGINLPFRPESIFSRSMNEVWHSRIECHGESKEDAEELRDAVLALITAPQPVQGEAVLWVNAEALADERHIGINAVRADHQDRKNYTVPLYTQPPAPAVGDDELARLRKEASGYHEAMTHLGNMRMEHGTCRPRSRRACTSCNASDALAAMIDSYAGPRLVRSCDVTPAVQIAAPGDVERLPEPAFRLKWKHGAYYVSEPNIGDTDCYTAEQMQAALRPQEQPIAADVEQRARSLLYAEYAKPWFNGNYEDAAIDAISAALRSQGQADSTELRGIRDTLIVAANNPLSHGGMLGLCEIMLTQARRITAAIAQQATGDKTSPTED